MSTLTLTDLNSLADKCAEISNELADHDGFVAARELAKLKKEDFDSVLQLLRTLRKTSEKK
jgi:flagellar motility protein MotE (MotC chaperone)